MKWFLCLAVALFIAAACVVGVYTFENRNPKTKELKLDEPGFIIFQDGQVTVSPNVAEELVQDHGFKVEGSK